MNTTRCTTGPWLEFFLGFAVLGTAWWLMPALPIVDFIIGFGVGALMVFAMWAVDR